MPSVAIEAELNALQYPEDGFVTFHHRADEKTFKQLLEYLDLQEYNAELMDGLFDDEDEVPLSLTLMMINKQFISARTEPMISLLCERSWRLPRLVRRVVSRQLCWSDEPGGRCGRGCFRGA